MAIANKPHVVCIPYPAQGHIKAMLKLAKLFHSKGMVISFVNTEFNHKRLLKSGGLTSLDGLPGFKFETIPDGLPPSDIDATQDIHLLCESILEKFLAPFLELVEKLSDEGPGVPPVTSIVSDSFMSFTSEAGEKLGIPVMLFCAISACSFMGFYQYRALLQKGVTPLKDESYLTNGYLDTIIDWIPGMNQIRLGHLPSFVRTTDPNDFMYDFAMDAVERATKATGLIIHTYDELETQVLGALSSIIPAIYTIGPQQLLLNQVPSTEEENLNNIGYSLWKEEATCIQWLDSQEPNSVVYVNFGSIALMSANQLVEFGWGLANSNHKFLWIIRPDVVIGESAVLETQFMDAVKERGFIASWCPQEEVLNHVAVAGFLTHCGWNSIMESLAAGVPMLCWPFFGDQQTNCKYLCNEWECGMEIDNDVKRDEVEELVRELMDGEKGKKMKNKAMEWKKMADKACCPGGSSYVNLDKVASLLQ